MAKSDDRSSTIEWIWLRDALELAIAPFGSKVLAKKRVTEWLAAGEVPWCCMSWKGLDAKSLAKMQREGTDSKGATVANLPSVAHCPGEPGFWSSNLTIDWEDNGAREVKNFGAEALGIKVSREHLLALPHIEPAKRKLMKPKEWLAKACRESPQLKNELRGPYARRLHGLMQTADVSKVWSFETLRRRLYDT
jgi:hypothetical protein